MDSVGEAPSDRAGRLLDAIGERDRFEAALRQSEARYQTLFDAIDEGFCVVEILLDGHGRPADYRFLEINQTFAAETGLGGAEGKTALELVPDLEPWWIETYGNVALTGTPVRFENRAEAMHRLFEVYAFRLGARERRQVAIRFKNITERRRIELRDRLLAQLGDAIRSLTDPVAIQAAATRVLGTHLGASRVYYVEVEPDDEHIVVAADYSDGVPSVAGRYHLASYGPTLPAEYRAGRTVVIQDTKDDPRVPESLRAGWEAIGVSALVGVPLVKGGRFAAALGVDQAEPRAWTPDEVALVEETAERTWAAVERATAESALLASQGLTRDVLDSMAAHVAVLDRNGTITFVNESWRRFAIENGADPSLRDVGVGTDYLGVCGSLPEDEDEDAAAIDRGLRDVLAGERDSFAVEYPCHSPTALRWFLLTASPLRRGGGGAVISHVNITERRLAGEALRESEERFHVMADTISQFAWVADAGGRIFWYNQRWFDYTGTTLDEMQGWGWQSVLHPDHLDRVVASLQRSWSTGEPWEDTFPLRGEDGTYRWFLSSAQPLRDAAGNVVRWFGTNTDIDDVRQAQEALALAVEREQAARAEAEAANRAKDDFLSVLSHELRTPLTPIFGFVQMLRRGTPTPERLQQGLEMIERNARIEARIVEDLLDVSRILSGKLLVQAELLDFAPIVRAATAAAQPSAESKGVSITTLVEPGGCWVTGDQVRLRQVVDNLLTNAIKFTPAGGTVGVTLAARDDEAWLIVQDSGDGIPADSLARIFDRFHQADSSSTRAQGGLGLGLAIVQHLVERHGGRVRAESDGRGHGATFTVILPLATRPSDDRATDSPALSTRGAGRLAGLRILVVDDDEDTRAFLRILLTEEGARVETAGSSAEALATLAGARVDLLIADIGMPGEDGHTMIARLRARNARDGGGIPAIALTAYASAEDRQRALEAGFQQHLTKPADLDALVAAILATVSGHTQV